MSHSMRSIAAVEAAAHNAPAKVDKVHAESIEITGLEQTPTDEMCNYHDNSLSQISCPVETPEQTPGELKAVYPTNLPQGSGILTSGPERNDECAVPVPGIHLREQQGILPWLLGLPHDAPETSSHKETDSGKCNISGCF